jgi:hypothetical protein
MLGTGLYTLGQDTSAINKFEFKGYIKDLQSITLDSSFSNSITNNLIHNRLNFKWKPSKKITGVLELRNRFFWGEGVKDTPNFAKLLLNQNEVFDLSKTWINNGDFILLSNVERFWLGFHNEEWNINVGRQRINWGIATMWNPNDLFNTYNFLDFDYEERPGSDAFSSQYNFPNFSIQFALATLKQGSIGAMKLFLNKWNYDFQLINGWYFNQFTTGAGWAGSIQDIGFKGELMFFAPNNNMLGQFTAALEWDYMFQQGWYTNFSGLFNSRGINRPVNHWQQLNFQLSPKNLLPTKWTSSFILSKEINPLLSGNVTLVYSPGVNLLILLPGFKYNLATNLDVDIIWQSFLYERNHNIEDFTHNAYLRLKWSF